MEPIFIKDLVHIKVDNINDSIRQLPTGNALIYTFFSPSTLYFGTIPRQATVIWRNKNKETLYSLSSKWTYFHWGHIVELVINTGLVRTQFEIPNFLVDIIFFISDPLKFSSITKLEDLKEFFVEKLTEIYSSCVHKHDTITLMQVSSQAFFDINRNLSKFGVSLTSIQPVFRKNSSD